VDERTKFAFPAWHFDCPPLGEIKMSDLSNVDHLSVEYRESMRHTELLVTGREGPTGAWHYIAFGALNPLSSALLPVDFSWDRERRQLITPESSIKVNWAAVSRSPDIDTFPWDFGMPL
jgi:hypothetical protein